MNKILLIINCFLIQEQKIKITEWSLGWILINKKKNYKLISMNLTV